MVIFFMLYVVIGLMLIANYSNDLEHSSNCHK